VQLIKPEGPRIGSHCVYLLCVAPLALLALGLINWVFSNHGLVTVPYGIHIYGVCMVFLAGKSRNTRSYTVYIYSCGQPYVGDVSTLRAHCLNNPFLCAKGEHCLNNPFLCAKAHRPPSVWPTNQFGWLTCQQTHTDNKLVPSEIL